MLLGWSDVTEPVRVNVGGAEAQATLSGEDGELVRDTAMLALVQVSENGAAVEVAAIGLVMTIVPDPLAGSVAGVYVTEVTGRVPASLNVSARGAEFPLGSLQW
jgi:hypothetical protein